MTYAQHTKVPVDQTRIEIERAVKKYGATEFASFTAPQRAVIMFQAGGRRIRFDLPLPDGETEKDMKIARQRWRALLLCIKAKLESVESKIETFEEAFLAHVVMPDGITVGEHTQKMIEQSYSSGRMVPLLPDLRSKP